MFTEIIKQAASDDDVILANHASPDNASEIIQNVLLW